MRIRTIKPPFFLHEGIFDAETETGLPLRLAFIGLWCAADREGRFKWSPRRLKTEILPYDEVDFSRVLDALTTRGFIVRYACPTRENGVDGDQLIGEYGVIPSFKKHQVINHKEKPSELPKPSYECSNVDADNCNKTTYTRGPRVPDACLTRGLPRAHEEGKGREGKGFHTHSSSGDDLATATDEIQDDQASKSRSTRQKTDWIMELWNEKADARLPRCSVWSPKRRGLAAARLCDHPDRADWGKAIAAVNASTFCTGQGPRGWLASIDWLLRPETIVRLIEGQFADGQGKTRIEAHHGQSSGNAGQGPDAGGIVKPAHKSAGFWRHPEDPIPSDQDKERAGEWDAIRESLAQEMDPNRFEAFENELTTCEAVSDSDLWLIVCRSGDRASMFMFRDEPIEIAGRDLHVAIDDTEEYAQAAKMARLPY